MSIVRRIVGNLLDTDARYIAHGCNAQGVMGAGVALALRRKWPQVYGEYRAQYDRLLLAQRMHMDLPIGDPPIGLPLGEVYEVQCGHQVVLNCITQEFVGGDKRYVSYDAVDECFRHIARLVPRDGVVAIPRIGAGLAGGDWDVIETIINKATPDTMVWLYDLPGAK
jgi:O-acetyl-ADP-ribose deacetylase (regulator of RNase III)